MTSEVKAVSDIFECQLCGDCCNGFGGTYVTKLDIINISRYICFDPEKFITRYCDPSGSRHVLTLGKDGFCIFFDKTDQCTIHPVKPYMCKAWPFIQTIIDHPENWNAMANSCPGMKKNIPYKDLQKIVAKEKEKLDNPSQDISSRV
ncbi:MAG: YkgJ family cysteine cluster protein [Desulfobacula sp.]|jgi:Fe-S-cluster containining protein|nr:YkgJ family cysteine cluster protein [Desulfobacula sp.]